MNVLRQLLRSAGIDVVRFRNMPSAPIDLLALAVRDRVGQAQFNHVVQIGAHDGISNDPIRAHLLRHRPKALLVEPRPDAHARLQVNYEGQPNVTCVNCAVGATDGTAVLYTVRDDPALPSWAAELASFDRQHLSSRRFRIPRLESYILPLDVPVRSLRSLTSEHGWDRIDLLQIDTEGFDCRLVMHVLEDELRPTIINYESIHAPLPEQRACKEALIACGYRFADTGWDTLAIREIQD